MKILLINNNDSDGVGQHFVRIVDLLNQNNHNAKGLVVHKKFINKNIIRIRRNPITRFINTFNYLKKKDFSSLFSFGYGGVEYDKIKKFIVEADLIIIFSFFNILSIKTLEKILFNHKNVIFRPLDMELISGGCHVNIKKNNTECSKYKNLCEGCPQLKSFFSKTSKTILNKKKKLLNKYSPNILVENSYTEKIYKNSSIGKKLNIKKVFLGVNSNRINIIKKLKARKELNLKKKYIYITYGSHILKARHKGGHLVDEIFSNFTNKILKSKFSEDIFKIKFITFGDNKNFKFNNKYIENIHLGIINEKKLNLLYQACDLLISPATFDNGPHIVSEAVLNNLPIISFNQGIAIDSILNGVNGYKVKCFNINRFAECMIRVIFKKKLNFNKKKLDKIKNKFNPLKEIKNMLEYSNLNDN